MSNISSVSFDEVVSLGVKLSGEENGGENDLEGVYQLNGVEYVVCGGTAVENKPENFF
jgi:hypothetical protein